MLKRYRHDVSGMKNMAFLALCRVFILNSLLNCQGKGGNRLDQKKTGAFLKALRKEKELTQEQLAEHFNVSDRTVSRWENGNNMPDLSLLVDLADFYDVDIREIIDGERKSENMNFESKETLEKVAEYVDHEKKTRTHKINKYFRAGLACFVVVILDRQFGILSCIFQENIDELVSGALCSLGLLFEFIGLYNNNHDVSFRQKKIAWMNGFFKKQQ